MNRITGIVLTSVVAVLTVLAILTGVAGSRKLDNKMRCNSLCINMIGDQERKFFGTRDIEAIVRRDFGGVENRFCREINLDQLEKAMEKQGGVERCTAYITCDGVVHVDVLQRTPVVMFKSEGSMAKVADAAGNLFHAPAKACEGLPCINGSDRTADAAWVAKAAAMTDWISRRGYWNIHSMNCDSKGCISIRVADRKETFMLGQPEMIKEKFDRVEHYIHKIAPAVQDREYRSVDVRYDGQIVCK